MKFFLFFVTLLPMVLITSQSFTFDQDWQNKVEVKLLESAINGNNVEFLIVLENTNDFSHLATLTKDEKATAVYQALKGKATAAQQNVISVLENKNASYRSFFIINMVHTRGNIELIETLARMPEVLKIQSNPVGKIQQPVRPSTNGSRELTWGLTMMGVPQAWNNGYKGQGVIVGGQDTGYEWEHPAIKSKYRGWNGTSADHNYNWHDAIHEQNPLNEDANNPCGFDSVQPCDDDDHGTHTMGTMVGENDTHQFGVAPDAKWIACRNMDRGWGQLSTYLECFEWFLAPTDLQGQNPNPTKAPHVIANSWECPAEEGCNNSNFAVLETAVNNLKSSGVVVVVSAGNSGEDCSTVLNPAPIFENSFTIGATDSDDKIAGFSSRGPVMVDGSNRLKPDVSAPGVEVYSCIRNGAYSSFSGTSMAGPHVVGVVALMISANPNLAGDVDRIEAILKETAVQKTSEQDCGGVDGETIPNNTFGYGRVDAWAAVQKALESVSTKEVKLQGISVSPNPFFNKLYFDFATQQGLISLDLFDVNGKLIYTKEQQVAAGERISIDLDNVAKGVYFYHLKTEKGSQQGKVVKQ